MANTKLFEKTVSPVAVAKAGFEGMMRGKLTVFGGVSFVQRLFVSLSAVLPKKLLMNQIYDMQQMKA